jgi:SAM-dependent methyltransferase
VGVDIDTWALTLGYRSAALDKQSVCFYQGSGDDLRFPDGTFSLVICRNALTYMHQRRAVREMCRVLRPGGLLLLRFENVWYDLRRLLHPRGVNYAALVLRDWFWGVLHSSLGWQPMPGRCVLADRTFATVGRLRKYLRSGGCLVQTVQASRRCPRFWGFATQTSLLAGKQ